MKLNKETLLDNIYKKYGEYGGRCVVLNQVANMLLDENINIEKLMVKEDDGGLLTDITGNISKKGVKALYQSEPESTCVGINYSTDKGSMKLHIQPNPFFGTFINIHETNPHISYTEFSMLEYNRFGEDENETYDSPTIEGIYDIVKTCIQDIQ